MAGLEVLFTCFTGSISCPYDALVCFVHWELITSGFQCLGSGDEPCSSDRKSDLLPPEWSSNKEVYSLRYQARNSHKLLLLKAVAVDSDLIIFNLMDLGTLQLTDLTVNVHDHVVADQLHTFDHVYKDTQVLSNKVKTQLFPLQNPPVAQGVERRTRRADSDPPSGHRWHPERWPRPHRSDSIVSPFSAGGADLDPLGSQGGASGGMIVDPLRSGHPDFGFDPSSGIPGTLPPGAIPPGARFDPFGPIGRYGSGPDPDHLRPPDYDDDMYM